ncbi:sigma-54-dependent Fis family transcriptional re gulator [Desulfonema ishimotonii]|uniref:Sigma-54-dependent Fis family transcriptional re gulator n=1 Tax=Desulfonema ishimotonii TaxID=45657 RepID=A0A401FZL4_9BACT|nr:sigma 54-interacting transcriptional regulator [Desulfonema ishimotonii]GBC62432.1 sigma-54-dependent Fis family transcriptional re gulator [Desulfonema ishimotonii]
MKDHKNIPARNLKKRESPKPQIRVSDQAESRSDDVDARYMTVFEKSGAPAIIIEADMTILRANPKFEQLTGFSKREIEGRMKWRQFVVEEDRERMERYHTLRRINEAIAPDEYECKTTHKSGELRYIFMKVGMIPGTRKSIASFTDITPLKQTEQALRESERRISTLMGNLPGMAYRGQNDPRRTMIFLSQGCRGLIGIDPPPLSGETACAYADLIHLDDREMVHRKIQAAIAKGHSYELVYRVILTEGVEKWVWEKGVAVYSPDNVLVALEGFITDFTDQKRSEQALVQENMRLRSSMKERWQFGNIVGKSPPMQKVYELILNAAASDAGVIIYGESGTGKELVARAIHDMSKRNRMNFVPINCGAIPENLFESEFFGYKRGAFSGAHIAKKGYIDMADGGTLFLDEMGEISLNMQVKLLRAIEGGGYTPLGGNDVHKPNIRIVAATNRKLKDFVRKGLMREDFFYRIHIIPIHIPPLRERKEDLPLLIDYFLQKYDKTDRLEMITDKIMKSMDHYDWPGNVRELQNVLHRYATLNRLDFIDSYMKDLSRDSPHKAEPEIGYETEDYQTALKRFEKDFIRNALERHQWHKEKTAKSLGIPLRTFFRKLKKLGFKK